MKRDLYDKLTAYIIENQNKFYRLAFSYMHNQEDALDVVQNAVCRALEHSGELRNADAMKTWFYRILVNESLLFLRKNKRFVLDEDGADREIVYEEPGFEIQDSLYEQISRLDEDVQSIIKLHYYEEMTLREISQVMEMNLNTVKAKMYRGLKALKVVMQEVDV